MEFNTIALHGGQSVDSDTKSRALPIYQTAAYVFENTEDAADIFAMKKDGKFYTRLGNPTLDVLEKRVSMLEGGVGAVSTATGMAAVSNALLTILKTGDELVASTAIYGGTHSLLADTFEKLGIHTIWVNSNNPKDYEDVITEKTKLIYAETLGNPRLDVFDVEGVAGVAHKNGIPLIVDNTIPSPYLLRPIEFGADIVVHSATKYLGGHGTSLAGIIVDSGNFDWAKSGKFPDFTEPDKGYNNLIYCEHFGKSAFIAKVRAQMLRDFGACLSPINAFLILQGIETLSLRMKEHSKNALAVAKFLENNEHVSWVNYPGLESNKNYELAKKYLPKGQSGIIGFGIKGGFKAGARFIDNVKLLSHLANIGDAKSLVIHPASTTHGLLTKEERLASGVSDDFIRLSIGIEDVNDIISDIKQALEA